jgi:hypothetical protein
MSVSDEDLVRLVELLRAKGYDVKDNGGRSKMVLEERFFRRMEKFGGEDGRWQEWIFNLVVTVGGVDRGCVAAMEKVLKECSGPLSETTLDFVIEQEVKAKFANELYGVLCSLTTGEANVVVRSVIAKGVGYCGFSALHVLNLRFNPKTPALVLQHLGLVINPAPVKDVRLLAKALEDWEAKTVKLKMEFNEEFSETVRVAILISMLP